MSRSVRLCRNVKSLNACQSITGCQVRGNRCVALNAWDDFTKQELQDMARRRGIKGRSYMSKKQLYEAIFIFRMGHSPRNPTRTQPSRSRFGPSRPYTRRTPPKYSRPRTKTVRKKRPTPCGRLMCKKGIRDKSTFRKWAARGGHPDKGGKTTTFQKVLNCLDKKQLCRS